jgi:hypothetical protein
MTGYDASMDPARLLLDTALICSCGAPVQRTEIRHTPTPDGWIASGAIVVCRDGCRVEVEPLGHEETA